MKRGHRRWAIVLIGLCCVVALAFWQAQALARLAVIAAVEGLGHVRLSFERAAIHWDRANFAGVRVTSLRGEPIAEIRRLDLAYNLRDLLPGGRRLLGLKAVEVDTPHLTIIRRPDGTYNIPIPKMQRSNGPQSPLIVRVAVRNGSVAIVDESRNALPDQRRLYVSDFQVSADICAQRTSRYAVDLRYGESPHALYPIVGRGEIDEPHGYVDNRWTAAHLPIAGAVDFAAGSPALRLDSGSLRNLEIRYFGFNDASGTLAPHLFGSAWLQGARIAIAGLSKPIENVHGGIDVYDDGLLTPGLDARVAGVAARVSGGIYGLTNPQARIAVRGEGDLTQLRSAFTQAQRLPIRGPLGFSLLIEGAATNPTTWVGLHAPRLTYAGSPVNALDGVVAFAGHEADIVGVRGAYGRVNFTTRGHVMLDKEPNAVDMFVQAHAPPGGAPYLGDVLPQLPLNVAALATADDPKSIALRGALWGSAPTQRLDAIFNVDSRGAGSLGPLRMSGDRGSLYARVSLDHPHRSSFGVVAINSLTLAPARAILDASLFGGEMQRGIAAVGNARLRGAFGAASVDTNIVSTTSGALRGVLSGGVSDEASFGATVAGRLQSPRVAGTVVVAGGRYRDFDVNGNAGLAFDDGTLRVHDAAVAVGPLFVGVAGTIEGLTPRGGFAPQYDLATQLHTTDVSALMATVQPRAAPLIQGSVDADLHVRGTGMSPSFAGSIGVPEGSINGLSLRDLQGRVSGNSGGIALRSAHVIVGSSSIAMSGAATRTSADVAVDAPQLDLADFNDFFDTGDTFAGNGSLALRASVSGGQIVASSGAATFSNARFRRMALGNVAARWQDAGDSIDTALRFGGPAGELALTGSVAPAAKRVNLQANARSVDLATWLPMLGFNLPITGRLDAQTYLAGAYPDIAMRVHAAVFGGTAGRLPIQRFEVDASASNGRGSITSAVLEVPELTTTASGTFGLRADDPLALVVKTTSPDVGAFLNQAAGKNYDLSGTFNSTLFIEGTRDQPRVRDQIALDSLRHGDLTVPRVAGEIDADRRAVALRNGEVDLERGKVLLAAAVPIRLTRSGPAPGSGPISGTLTATDVELSNFAALLPKGTQLTGRIDGQASAGGTPRAPQVNGSLALRDGTFNGPMEKSPITGISGDLAFAGSRAQLHSHAFVGGGAITATAAASLADLQRPADATFTLDAAADNARFDLPAYFQGTLNGKVALVRARGGAPSVSGDLSVYNARVPLDAFLSAKSGGKGPALPDVAFNGLQVAAGSNVRVQSANVDIGATGAVRLGGTLNAPTLAGVFHSTGGSLNFYRNFQLQRGDVSFDPSSGVIPDVNAVATTFVTNPATAVELHVTGPATNMNLALSSDPPYDKQQILGLLLGLQQYGAVAGVQSTGGGNFTAGSAAQSLALGQLNTVFTRNLLEPLNASLGSALGFTEVQITSDIQTGLGVNAVKAFGKNVNAIWSQSFGYPKTQAIALDAHPNVATGLRLTAYTSQGPTLFALQQPQPVGMDVMNLNPLTSFTPISGSNGVSFSYQKKFP